MGEQFLAKIRDEHPLVHCITNIVVANFQANGLLALGASPVMADAIEEVAEMASVSQCTVLNIGTLKDTALQAMLLAGKSANEHQVPVILDPVGAGATTYRKNSVMKIVDEVEVSLIRCNAGELAALANIEWTAKGVDAGTGKANIKKIAMDMAKKYRCIIAVSGLQDFVTDGIRGFSVTGGHSLMTKVTGTGCLLSAVAGAFLAVCDHDKLEAVVTALAFYKKAGETAASRSIGPGSFKQQFIDALSELTDREIDPSKVKEIVQ